MLKFFLVDSASCHFTLPHFIRPLRVLKFVPKKILSLHLLLEVDDHDEDYYSVVPTLGER